MGMPLTIEQLEARFGKDEPSPTGQAQMEGDADARSPLSNEDLAAVMGILVQHGAIHVYPEPDVEVSPSGSRTSPSCCRRRRSVPNFAADSAMAANESRMRLSSFRV